MRQRADDRPEGQIPLLPNERFELALDSKKGAVNSAWAGPDSLTITTRRAIRLSVQSGRRITSIMPLERITGIDVVDVTRASERLTQGLIILGVGIVLGWFSWAVAGVTLISLVVGGLPVLVAIYMLAGYAFPDNDGMLVLHSGGHTLEQTLLSSDARRDAYLVAHRLYELTIEVAPNAPPRVQPETTVVTHPAPTPAERVFAVDAPVSAGATVGVVTSTFAANGASAELGALMRLTPASPSEDGPPLDAAERVARCVLAMEGATAYVSRQVVRDPSHAEPGDGDFVWDLEYAMPDAFRVSQTGWTDSREVHDEWVTIGQDFYRNAGRWQKPEDGGRFDGERMLSRWLTVSKYLPLLRTGQPKSAAVGGAEQGSYLMVEYDPLSRDALVGILDDPSPPQSVHAVAKIWIDNATDLMAKAEVSIEEGEGRRLVIEQAFASYNEGVHVERPFVEPASEATA